MRLRALALAGLSALLLTACSTTIEGSASPAGPVSGVPGTAAPSGPELSGAAVEALAQAGSVRIAGSMTVDGAPTDLDLRLRGDDAAGSMTLQGFTVQMLVVDGALYMQAPEEMWTAQGVPSFMAVELGSTWVLVPAGAQDFADFSFAGMVAELRSPDATIEDEVIATELDGQPVWEMRDSDGTVVLVAAVGEPYPLQMTNTGPEAGVMRFSEFGGVAPIEPPADYLDLEDFGG